MGRTNWHQLGQRPSDLAPLPLQACSRRAEGGLFASYLGIQARVEGGRRGPVELRTSVLIPSAWAPFSPVCGREVRLSHRLVVRSLVLPLWPSVSISLRQMARMNKACRPLCGGHGGEGGAIGKGEVDWIAPPVASKGARRGGGMGLGSLARPPGRAG